MVYHYHRQIQHGWQPPWPNNSAIDNLISMKFGRPMQNDMLMTINRSKSKPEVEFQYDGRWFQQPEVVISTTDWVILSKFGLQTDYDLVNKVDPALWLYLHWRCRHCYWGCSIHSFIHSFIYFFLCFAPSAAAVSKSRVVTKLDYCNSFLFSRMQRTVCFAVKHNWLIKPRLIYLRFRST